MNIGDFLLYAIVCYSVQGPRVTTPRPKVGNINASGEESVQSALHASITGLTGSGTGIGALLALVLSRSL